MLDQFKNGKHNIMIATDVAGRGIHVDGVSHVVNFTLPEQSDDYVHRIGRTGRAGTQRCEYQFPMQRMMRSICQKLKKPLGKNCL